MTATVEHAEPHGSIALLIGTDEDGQPLTIAADFRMATAIAAAIDADGPVEVEYEDWQVLR